MLCDFSNIVSKSNEISNSTSLCTKILNDTGFAMVAGSDFGIDENILISRIAFVDFDGKKALEIANNYSNLSNDFLKNACPNIINGINELKKWIRNYSI
jgi:aspartate aminotransferase